MRHVVLVHGDAVGGNGHGAQFLVQHKFPVSGLARGDYGEAHRSGPLHHGHQKRGLVAVHRGVNQPLFPGHFFKNGTHHAVHFLADGGHVLAFFQGGQTESGSCLRDAGALADHLDARNIHDYHGIVGINVPAVPDQGRRLRRVGGIDDMLLRDIRLYKRAFRPLGVLVRHHADPQHGRLVLLGPNGGAEMPRADHRGLDLPALL